MDTSRLHEIKSLPDFMQDAALVDWPTAAALMSTCVPSARKIVRDNGIPLVELSERKRLPRARLRLVESGDMELGEAVEVPSLARA